MPQSAPQETIEDLVDFYKRWPELKQSIVQLEPGDVVDERQKAILEWMTFVIDRVGPVDLELEGDF